MKPDWVSIIIALAIVAAVLLVYFQGRKTPAGASSAQVRKLFAEIEKLKGKTGNTATKAELALLAAQVTSLEQHSASSGEVAGLEGKINALRAELEGSVATVKATVDGIKATGEHTREGVSRIEAILMKGALDR